MNDNRRYLFLDQLRHGETSQERNHAFQELVYLEEEGQLKEKDFFDLFESGDQVYQSYAIGAMGRQKIESAIPKLKSLYLATDNPVILVALLQAFENFPMGLFEDVVLKRLQPRHWRTKIKLKIESSIEKLFDKDFVLQQILVPSLKYLQKSGSTKSEKVIKNYLKHPDGVVRWHVLEVFKRLKLSIDRKTLVKISENDDYALNREQANYMLEVKNKN